MSLSCYNSWINVICYDKFKFKFVLYHSHLVVKKNKSFNFLFGADMAVPVSDSSVVAHHPLYQTHAGLEPAICWIKKKKTFSNPSKASNVPAKCYGVKNCINKLFYNSQLLNTM